MCFLTPFCSRKLSIIATSSSHIEVLFPVSDVDVGVFVICDTVRVLPLLQAIDNMKSVHIGEAIQYESHILS